MLSQCRYAGPVAEFGLQRVELGNDGVRADLCHTWRPWMSDMPAQRAPGTMPAAASMIARRVSAVSFCACICTARSPKVWASRRPTSATRVTIDRRQLAAHKIYLGGPAGAGNGHSRTGDAWASLGWPTNAHRLAAMYVRRAEMQTTTLWWRGGRSAAPRTVVIEAAPRRARHGPAVASSVATESGALPIASEAARRRCVRGSPLGIKRAIRRTGGRDRRRRHRQKASAPSHRHPRGP